MKTAPVEIKLTHKTASEKLRLHHCVCYASLPSRTLRDVHVLLLDTTHPCFHMRKLIVAASRVTGGRYCHIATAKQEKQMICLAAKYTD